MLAHLHENKCVCGILKAARDNGLLEILCTALYSEYTVFRDRQPWWQAGAVAERTGSDDRIQGQIVLVSQF